MTLHAIHPVLMCRDIERSLAFYQQLDFTPAFTDQPEDPRYAGVRRDGLTLHLQWHAADQWDHDGDLPVTRFLVEDPDGLRAAFAAAGLDGVMTTVFDSDWGTREFHLRDPDGNGLHFYRDR